MSASASNTNTIYHMCNRADFERQMQEAHQYFPPTYQADGFIHASGMPYPVSILLCE
jgi:uncharacterized protein (DUF952 family)